MEREGNQLPSTKHQVHMEGQVTDSLGSFGRERLTDSYLKIDEGMCPFKART